MAPFRIIHNSIYKIRIHKIVLIFPEALRLGVRETTYHNGGASATAVNNPYTYRGYYYDKDLGLYYLQSRYYDSNICRFINADKFISTGQGLTGYNMFAYCGNNPVNRFDETGDSWKVILFGAITGALTGIITAAATGGNILEAATEGAMTGAVSASIGLMENVNKGLVFLIGCIAGASIDLSMQVLTQSMKGKSIDQMTINGRDILKTALYTGTSSLVPSIIGDLNVVDEYQTSIFWGISSLTMGILDLVSVKMFEFQ